jgi:glycosyltransferase involved in cell wall biosynthesis
MGQLDPEMVVKLNQISDIFLMTSQKLDDGDVEGFGIAVLEAALCGKPAIVSSGSGLGEAVIHNQTGLVVPVSDPAATSQAILFLSENEILRKEMGNKAKERALSEFSWEEVAEQYLELVHQLVKTR